VAELLNFSYANKTRDVLQIMSFSLCTVYCRQFRATSCKESLQYHQFLLWQCCAFFCSQINGMKLASSNMLIG